MTRGRPKLNRPVVVVQVKLRLYPGADDGLLAFFRGVPPRLRAAMVKRGLRSGVSAEGSSGENRDELLDALDSLVS